MRIFLDSRVLISAVRGEPEVREAALAILDVPTAEFWYSPLLELEVVLQPTFLKRAAELGFYREYFANAESLADLNRIYEVGANEAKKHGISVMDAFHLTAASLGNCDVFITTENPTKPMFRTKLIKVTSLSRNTLVH